MSISPASILFVGSCAGREVIVLKLFLFVLLFPRAFEDPV